MLTGCGPFTSTLSKLKIASNDLSRICGEEREEAEHLMKRCSGIERENSLIENNYLNTNEYIKLAEGIISALRKKDLTN